MNKMSRLAAVIVLGLSPLGVQAETYGSYSSDFNSTFPQVQSVLGPAGAALGAAAKPGDPKQALQQNLDKIQKALESSEKETKWRKELGDLRDKADNLRFQKALPDIIMSNKLKQREEKSAQLKNLFAGMGATPGQINSGDLNTQNLEASCRSGVDFTQFKQFAEQMGSEPFRFLRENGQKILDEKDKAAKEAKVANLQKLFKAFDDRAQEDDPEAPQQNLFAENLSQDKRLERLDAARKGKKQEVKDLRRELVRGFLGEGGFFQQLSSIEENDQKILQLAAAFADNLENYRKVTLDAGITGVQQLKANCDKNKNQVFPQAAQAAYQSLVVFHNGDEDFYARRVFQPQLEGLMDEMTCTDVTGEMDNLLGSQLQTAIAGMRQQKDPKALLQSAMQAMTVIGNAQSNVGAIIKPLMNQCQTTALNVKKAQEFTQKMQGQIASAASSQGGTDASGRARRGQGQGRGRQGAAQQTHNPAAPRR